MWPKVFSSLFIVTLFLEVALCLLTNNSDGLYRNAFRSRRKREEAKCTLPPQPANGRYKVTGGSVVDGKALFINLQYSCEPGFVLDGDASAFCYGGDWNELPRCVQTCRLMRHRSVRYNCIISGTEETRPCRDAELEGVVVQPTCQQPHYYTPIELPYMTCRRGKWNAWPTCIPECGLLSPKAAPVGAPRSVIPWHAAIYIKNVLAATHEHVCSGSLISNSVILSAAHCFWDENTNAVRDETNFAVAVGKTYSDWNHPDDEQYAQRSDVRKIVVPKSYRGAENGHHDDLAVVVVSRGFEYQHHVRPVCLDFKRDMLDKHLVVGNHGKSAGWVKEVSGAKALRAIDMPLTSRDSCGAAPAAAGDQLCAGNVAGPVLCGVDGGTGLVFASTLQNTTRYYLRGVATTSAASDDCRAVASFATITKHQALIKTYWFL